MKSIHMAVCLMSLLFTDCKTEPKIENNLNGRWILKYGEWNGQPAPMLEHIYFVFNKDSLQTNFTPSEQEETALYEIHDSTMIQKTSKQVKYDILSINDSTLEIATALKGADFKLVLMKE